MEVVQPGGTLLTVTEHGYGKRTEIDEYRVQSRGGVGIINIATTDKQRPGRRRRLRAGRRRAAAHHPAGHDPAHADQRRPRHRPRHAGRPADRHRRRRQVSSRSRGLSKRKTSSEPPAVISDEQRTADDARSLVARSGACSSPRARHPRTAARSMQFFSRLAARATTTPLRRCPPSSSSRRIRARPRLHDRRASAPRKSSGGWPQERHAQRVGRVAEGVTAKKTIYVTMQQDSGRWMITGVTVAVTGAQPRAIVQLRRADDPRAVALDERQLGLVRRRAVCSPVALVARGHFGGRVRARRAGIDLHVHVDEVDVATATRLPVDGGRDQGVPRRQTPAEPRPVVILTSSARYCRSRASRATRSRSPRSPARKAWRPVRRAAV